MNPQLMRTLLTVVPRLFLVLVPIIIHVKEVPSDSNKEQPSGEGDAGADT